MSDSEEPDRIEGQAHPRETYELFGQDAALALAARAIRTGALPQAWLLSGSPGLGKATLAYRMARYLLRYGATAGGPPDLFVAPNDIVSRQIAAQAHPGLLVLRRRENDKGKLRKDLDVGEIRRSGAFFGLTAGAGGWRIAIIDSADEMNDNAANALLKILEEPPARALFILISHAPGRLLSTIRSRTQRLDLKPLHEKVLTEALQRLLPETTAKDRVALARLSEGSLGLALRLSGEDGLKLARDADLLLNADGELDFPGILKLSDRVGRSTDGLMHFGEFLIQALSRRIRGRALEGHGGERGVELWEQINSLFTRATGLNLEPRQTVLASAAKITAAKLQGIL